MTTPRPVGLEIDQDLAAQHREWRIARILWAAMAALVIAAALGTFGQGGPLATVDRRAGGLHLTHARFARCGATTDIRIEAATGEEVVVSGDLLDAYRLQSVVPQPREMQGAATRLVLKFAPAADLPLRVTLNLLPTARGSVTGTIATADGSAVEVRQFIYP